MRIDDENKVVWCSENLMEWKESLTKIGLIKAIVDNYEFKLEQPKKYYWRKKKEHLAWFEKIEESYLIRFKFSGETTHHYAFGDIECAPFKMTESEARDLLKDDFDKFEKVECE